MANFLFTLLEAGEYGMRLTKLRAGMGH